MTPLRLVFDTNVVLSALLFHAGNLSWLRPAWQSDNVQPLVSHPTVAELLRVLTYPKFQLSVSDTRNLLDEYLPYCETIKIPDPAPSVPICRDPKDRPFLELTIATQADALITGDADILTLAKTDAVSIWSPSELKKYLTPSLIQS